MEAINNEIQISEKSEVVNEILAKNDFSKNKLIPILQEVQEAFRYLPEDVMRMISEKLCIPAAKVYGVATFYSHFALKPKGKNVIKVCDGTACHVKNSIPIVEAIEARLNLDGKNNTTADMLFTLETVSCLGACGLAPVVVINEEVYSQMNPQKINKVIDEIYAGEVEDAKIAG